MWTTALGPFALVCVAPMALQFWAAISLQLNLAFLAFHFRMGAILLDTISASMAL